jgi:DNA-binding transcriptional regulator YiaG
VCHRGGMTTLQRLARVRRMASTGEARRIRERAGLRRSEVATDLGITPNRLTTWELGLRSPSGEAAVRWGRLLEALDREYR